VLIKYLLHLHYKFLELKVQIAKLMIIKNVNKHLNFIKIHFLKKMK